MANIHGKSIQVVMDQYELTGFREAGMPISCETVDTTTFRPTSDYRTQIAGLKNSSLTLDGVLDNTATTGNDALLKGQIGAGNTQILIGHNALNNGSIAFCMSAVEGQVETSASFTDAVMINGAFEGDRSMGQGLGYCLGTLNTAVTADSNTTGVNVGVSTGGIAAFLAVTGVSASGSDSLVVKLQQSSDDGSGDAYADIVTFSTVTNSASSERSLYTTATEAYLRLNIDVTIADTSANSYTFCCFVGHI